MPAGANGKLYGAVTTQTIADELLKQGFSIERKRVELPGNNFKSVGKYKVMVKLYENASAEVNVTVQGQELKVETKNHPLSKPRRRRDIPEGGEQLSPGTAVSGIVSEPPAESTVPEAVSEPPVETGAAPALPDTAGPSQE
jgi:large subunit ribosomal protein L9